MINRTMLFAAATLSLATGLAVSQPALAAPSGSQMMIRQSDLDLSTEAGRKELDRRIERAARKVCTIPARTGTQLDRVDGQCFAAAVASAKANLTGDTKVAARN